MPSSRRKAPVQARARATVEAILEATSQVLVTEGYARMTTTRVAERAGVSVGTLYQYFDDKAALVRSLAEVQLERMVTAMQAAALRTPPDADLEARVRPLLAALLEDKAKDGERTEAVAKTMLEIEGASYLERTLGVSQQLVQALLAAHPDQVTVTDPELASLVVVRAVEGVMGSIVADPRRDLGDPGVLEALVELVLGYLTRPR